MLTITIKANVPAADAQGIKERIAMDIERYGDCKVVSIKDKIKYQGQAYDFIAFDELTHFTWEEYSYLFSRNRPNGPGTRVYIVSDRGKEEQLRMKGDKL